jgi:hypothetical protein
MTRSHPTLEAIDLSDLDAVSGGQMQFKWDESSPRSENVIDCRGSTCVDSTGKTDWKSTLQHKYGIGHERQQLPKPDDGPLGGPKSPNGND